MIPPFNVHVHKEKYRVVDPNFAYRVGPYRVGPHAYKGEDLEEAIATFCECIRRQCKGAQLLKVVEGHNCIEGITPATHSVTQEALVQAYLNRRVLALLYGITWEEWLAHGPEVLRVPN